MTIHQISFHYNTFFKFIHLQTLIFLAPTKLNQLCFNKKESPFDIMGKNLHLSHSASSKSKSEVTLSNMFY